MTVGRWLAIAIVILLNLWATAALYFDLRFSSLRIPAAIVYSVAIVALLVAFKGR